MEMLDAIDRASKYTWKKWRRAWAGVVDREDAFQEMFASCWSRRHLYDPARGASQMTYFVWVARASLSEVRRKFLTKKRSASVLSLDVELPGRKKIVDTVQDWGPPPLDVIIHKESLDSMLGSLQQVSGRRLEAVRHYYGIGEEAKTLQETGDAMGVSRQRAHALVTEAVAFLRDTESQPETL